MDFPQRDMSFQSWNLQTRRLTLLSDTIKDYQENMRNIIRILGRDTGNSNVRRNASFNSWMDLQRGFQSTHGEPFYSFNRTPVRPTSQRRTTAIPTNINMHFEREISVNNGLNSEQIEHVTQLMPYDSSMNETLCPITWDPFEIGQEVLRINNCGHIFGKNALIEWFQQHNICPVCRTLCLPHRTEGSMENRRTHSSSNAASFLPSMRGRIERQPANVEHVSNSGSNLLINNLVSGILTSLNGALNDETGYYENEFIFNLADLMEAYNPASQQTTTSEHSSNSDIPENAI